MRRATANQVARFVTWDLESSFNIGGYFGPTWDVNIAKVIQHHYVLGFAWKYLGERKVYSCYIWDFPLYKKQPRNDIEVIKKWREVMLSADIACGHNSDSFDNKVMTGRLMVHNLPPVPLPQLVDTKKMAKRVARFDSNKLDDLGELFGIGRKIHTDANLWWDCMQGVESAQRKMVRYNKQDVKLTEQVYLRMRPHAATHPNVANITGRPTACPVCGEEGFMWAQGIRYTKTGQYRRWQCKSCGSYVSDRKQEKTDKPTFV